MGSRFATSFSINKPPSAFIGTNLATVWCWHGLYGQIQKHHLHKCHHRKQALLPRLPAMPGPLPFLLYGSAYSRASPPIPQEASIAAFLTKTRWQRPPRHQEVLKDNPLQVSCGVCRIGILHRDRKVSLPFRLFFSLCRIFFRISKM